MLDSMLYHKIAIDSSFCNKLYPCGPIVRLHEFRNNENGLFPPHPHKNTRKMILTASLILIRAKCKMVTNS